MSDQDNARLTDHVEDCTTCQRALRNDATGEIPIDELLSGIHRLNPADESNDWQTIARVEQERSMITGEELTTALSGNGAVEPVATPGGELDFLDPSDDPAYLGKLHHFQIARVIGRGGMGIVLEAFDPHLHRNVAIKVLNPQYQANEIARQRFCREGRAAAAISHEHVVPMYHVAKAHEGEVARLSMQIAAGLSAAHKREMVHRDIKPANIMSRADNGDNFPSVVLPDNPGTVWSVDFAPDGKQLVTGEQGGAARVWDLSTGDIVTTLRGHASAVHNVSLDPTAHRIATSNRDRTIRVWDMSSVECE